MELTWDEIQAAVKALSPELQERLYYSLQDRAVLDSDEVQTALEQYHNDDLVDL